MSPLEWALVVMAGAGAGGINTLVGSGTLITFPTLLAFGVPPVTANMSNSLGLVPGSFSGAWGYRRELAGQKDRALRLLSASVVGSVIGALLLLWLPDDAFTAIVPALIVLGVVLVLAKPWINAWSLRRQARTGHRPARLGDRWFTWPGTLLTGVYGGYFGAAQGIILLAVLGLGVPESLQRLNALKNVLSGTANLVAGVVFMIVAWSQIDWWIVLAVGIGAAAGAQVAARYGRTLPEPALRWTVAVVGVVALIAFLLR